MAGACLPSILKNGLAASTVEATDLSLVAQIRTGFDESRNQDLHTKIQQTLFSSTDLTPQAVEIVLYTTSILRQQSQIRPFCSWVNHRFP
jgi:hypothetical protein